MHAQYQLEAVGSSDFYTRRCVNVRRILQVERVHDWAHNFNLDMRRCNHANHIKPFNMPSVPSAHSWGTFFFSSSASVFFSFLGMRFERDCIWKYGHRTRHEHMQSNTNMVRHIYAFLLCIRMHRAVRQCAIINYYYIGRSAGACATANCQENDK